MNAAILAAGFGTLEIVFEAVGPGTHWLAGAKPHDMLDVIGPLGRPFSYPAEQTICLLIGGGYGAAPLYFLAEELRTRDKLVHMILGARSHDRVFKPIEGKRLVSSLIISTEDGSMGEPGRVTDLMPQLVERTGAQVVYACGPGRRIRRRRRDRKSTRLNSSHLTQSRMPSSA